jgi:hypothetical protein
VKLDWERGHGPVTGSVNAATGALVASWAGHAAHVPPLWAAVTAGGGLIGTYIGGRIRRATRGHQALRAAGWLAAGTWCSLAVANGPWTHMGLGTLAGGSLALGLAMTGAKHVDEKAAEEEARAEAVVRRAYLDAKCLAIAEEWEARIARVAHDNLDVEVVGVDFWPEDAGYSLDVEMPAGGAKWKDLAVLADSLAADARLPEGCGVEVGSGAHRGAALVHVATVNALIGEVFYPEDYSPLSANGPAPLGIHRDRSVFAPITRQRSGLTVGQKGTGKTNLMNVKIANQLRMVDVLPWIIDLNGGGLALAWLHAWEMAGRPGGRPPIDWVADTPEKALELSAALVRIALARKPGYKHLEIEANDDKLPVSPAVPAIVCDNDEIAELFSPRARRDPILREVGDNLVRVQELGRAAATNVENAALRATQDVISEPQILKQSSLRIGLRCDEAELSYLMGWNDRLSPEDAPYPGCGFYKVDQEPARPFKVYRLTPNQIREIVVATADMRPKLDELSRRVAGEAYVRRWENTDHLFGRAPAPAAATPPTGTTSTAVAPPRPPAGGVTSNWNTTDEPKDTPEAKAADTARSALDDADAASNKLRAAMDDASVHDPDLDRQFRDIARGGGIDWEKAPVVPPADDDAANDEDPRKGMVFSIVQKAGPDGIGPEAIRDIFAQVFGKELGVKTPHAATIGRWLSADSRVHKPGGYGRYAVRPEQTGE